MALVSEGSRHIAEDNIQSLVEAGITVVVAAGNQGSDACNYVPANVPAAITVGSMSSIDFGVRRIDYANSLFNWGSCVDIFAPGDEVSSAWPTSDTASELMSGTSMACPHVSGAVALLRSWGVAAADVAETLKATATTGRIQALRGDSPDRLLYVTAPKAGSSFSKQCRVKLYEHWPEGLKAFPNLSNISWLSSGELVLRQPLAPAVQAWHGMFPTGKVKTFTGVGNFSLSGSGINKMVSSVIVEGLCCNAVGYKTSDCSDDGSTKDAISFTMLPELSPAQPHSRVAQLQGMIFPASKLKTLWGCNDCAQCVQVTQTC
jgi:hypothetical protein